MRDFYWDPGMAGINWQGIRDQYATLLPRLSSRGDLSDLLGELIGELDTSHTYIWGGGDRGVNVPSVSVGMLGADVERDGDAYRVKRIYHGDPADNVVSPLLAAGVGIKEGDYILAVDHRPFLADQPFYAAFTDRAGQPTLLTVNGKPTAEGAREVVVTPIPDEQKLRYVDWVRHNREYVAEKTGGKIGYIHIPDMWTNGLVAFNTWFYPQLDKEGLVVDARWNGGGAVSEMLVERLGRKVVSFDRARNGGLSTYPERTLNGPFVVLTNEFAGSDGDIFPMAIQLEKLAPVIGTRSWGGVDGMDNPRPFTDGGSVSTPQFAWWSPTVGWNLENRGVIPDIVVEALPQEVARGVDSQLDRGIAEVLKLHEQHPPVVPNWGPVPDKSRTGYKKEL
jgi:tricorn protease